MPVKRPLLIAAAATAVLVLAGAAGAYAYFFSGLRSTPTALSLKSPSPSASATPVATGTPAALAGGWTVATGSQAGYRVTEQFVGQTSPHQAVARTSDVSGTATVTQGASGLEATTLRFAAQLSSLHSQDTVAGFDVLNRDRIVAATLGVSQYPTATFTAQDVQLPAELASGVQVAVTVPGQLTIRGVTQPVQVKAQLQLNGGQLQAAGSTSFDMSQFGIRKPTQPFVTPESTVTLEFQLVLKPA